MAIKREVRVIASFTLKPEARRLLDKLARKQGRSRSQIVEHLILEAGEDDAPIEVASPLRFLEQDRLLVAYELREMRDPAAWDRVNEAYARYVESCKKKGRSPAEIGLFVAEWESMQQRDEDVRLVDARREMNGFPAIGVIVARHAPRAGGLAARTKAKDRHSPARAESRR